MAESVAAKMRWRILAPFVLLILFSSLDRVSIGFAALRMNRELGLSPEAYGFAAGIFFAGYLLFQFPSAALHSRWGTARWLAAIVLFWGLCAMAMAFVRDARALYVLRFLLGLGEAGLTPGIVWYCTTWMPQAFRARAVATTLLAIPISVVFGGPFSAWLISTANPVGLAGWRWMFLIQGGITIGLAAMAYRVFAQPPDRADWLTADEKSWLAAELERERAARPVAPGATLPFRAMLADGRLWLAALVWFALLLGSNGIIFWLPQIIKQLSGASDLQIGLLNAVPWIGMAIGVIANARHSDRTQERHWHVALPALLGAAGLVAAAFAGSSLIGLGGLFLTGLGIGAAQGVFWTIPGGSAGHAQAGNAITLINLIGNLASLTGPYMIGFFRARTGGFTAPVFVMAAALVVGAMLVLTLKDRR